MNSTRAEINLLQIFLVFLKIGATGFGGNVALVATVRREICERRKWLPDEEIIDGLSLGTVLPGALATNVIAFCGYRLRGLAGAMAALTAVLLPAFILICVLAELYSHHHDIPFINTFLLGMIPGLCGLIFATAIQMAQKNIRFPLQWVLVALSAAALVLLKSFWTTLLVMAVTGVIGWIVFRKKEIAETKPVPKQRFPVKLFVLASIIALIIVAAFVFVSMHQQETKTGVVLITQLGGTFGSMSLTLFGGGYVFVPAIGKVVVELHHWIPKHEFDLAIAIGQITPGPIMISAAFIGWKVAGFWGALISTIFIFLPPAVVMLIASHFLDRIRGNKTVEAIFLGLRAGVIGMIFAAVAYVGHDAATQWPAWIIFALSTVAVLKWKIDSAIIIPASGLLGYLLYLVALAA